MNRTISSLACDCLALLTSVRAWNVALRTAHIAAMAILLGGHAFGVERPRLLASLACTIGTGLVLAGIEAGPRLLWFYQGRGLMTLAKLGLVALVPCFWEHRLILMLIAVILASVGSHMPARFRYYSLLHRRVIRCGDGPGTEQLENDLARSNP